MNKELKRLVVSTTTDSLDYVEGIDNCYGIIRLHMTAIHNGQLEFWENILILTFSIFP